MIKKRVVELIEFKGVAKELFFTKIGVTSANFRGNAQKTPLNSKTIENILSEFPDINLEWLITGKGDMLKSDIRIESFASSISKPAKSEPHNCIYKELLKRKEVDITNINKKIAALNRKIGKLQEQLRLENRK